MSFLNRLKTRLSALFEKKAALEIAPTDADRDAVSAVIESATDAVIDEAVANGCIVVSKRDENGRRQLTFL